MNGKAQNNKAGVVAIVGVMTVVGGVAYLNKAQENRNAIIFQDTPKNSVTAPTSALSPKAVPETAPRVVEPPQESEMPEKPTVPAPPQEIVVHITGAVKKPGVYHLPIGSRGKDAIERAGGVLKGANSAALNLAAKLEDGSQLYIPTRTEDPKALAEKEYAAGNAPIVVSEKSVAKDAPSISESSRSAKPATKGDKGSKSSAGKLTDPSQGMVNINKAGEEELQRLPGIGPAMAARIMQYRQESGGFQTPEDLMQVTGIGEKKFAKMKAFVKVK